MAVGVIKAADLAAKLKAGDVVLIDVREPWEYQLAKIEGAKLMPLKTLGEHLAELPKDKEIVFHCHHGMRSMQACQVAAQQCFRVTNLSGGIAAWSTEVDPKVPQY